MSKCLTYGVLMVLLPYGFASGVGLPADTPVMDIRRGTHVDLADDFLNNSEWAS